MGTGRTTTVSGKRPTDRRAADPREPVAGRVANAFSSWMGKSMHREWSGGGAHWEQIFNAQNFNDLYSEEIHHSASKF